MNETTKTKALFFIAAVIAAIPIGYHIATPPAVPRPEEQAAAAAAAAAASCPTTPTWKDIDNCSAALYGCQRNALECREDLAALHDSNRDDCGPCSKYNGPLPLCCTDRKDEVDDVKAPYSIAPGRGGYTMVGTQQELRCKSGEIVTQKAGAAGCWMMIER